MTTTLASSLDIYLHAKAGTVEELSILVENLLVLSGYSLGQDDIKTVILTECKHYSGWAVFEAHKDGVIEINDALVLESYEWSIIEPAIKAHIDLLQAQRMESIRSIGTQEFGLSVSEARQIYREERDAMPKMAFIEEPYSLDLI